MADEILRADPRLRRKTLITIGFATILGLIALAMFRSWLTEIGTLPGNDLLIARLRRMIGIALTGSAICLALLAWYAVHQSARIRKARQWPAPGTRVMRDTRIRRGDAALRISRQLNALGITLLAFCIALGFMTWRMLATLG
ncbi:MAG: hypothetical protein E6Q43_05605 [Dokdonella sp.]|nr:MAG: hypothetical protein EYC71_00515 [Gammaproteobacteria bacterium]TXI73331.1 MAG: hypothetical protein E6Q43_05605 [Dokdonella sp.]